jgi:preprotein translocase subunit SecD
VTLALVLFLAATAFEYANAGASPTTYPAAMFRPTRPVSADVLKEAAEIMSKRLEAVVATSSSVTVEKNQIDLSLGGVKDPVRVMSLIGSPGTLYFRPVLCGSGPDAGSPHTAPPSALPLCISPYRLSSTDLSGQASSSSTSPAVDPAYSTSPSIRSLDDVATHSILVASNNDVPYPRVLLGPSEVLVDGKVKIIGNAIIKHANATENSFTNQWAIVIAFTSSGTSLYNAIAALDYGTSLAMDLDGTVLSAPIIEARTFPGTMEVAGDFNEGRATFLAAELNAGPLPVRFTLSVTLPR